MKQANGLIFKLTTTEHEYGRNSAFRTLMRYNTNGGHNRISFNMSRGVRPRDPASRILLQTLAGPRGKYIALEMLLKGPRARLYLKYKVPTE